ncbi:General transcription factor 3C polypeptide 5 [Perkinsus olseni]|uniref:General transcription factor 3C polypeptide 5 n=1 Tax=Perkinsus olseni TaxID=32597 RepID=A0A7J6NJI3_PEROL|nr:General transcription factor 3C polypeptide 5 [Perkinsus olseni]
MRFADMCDFMFTPPKGDEDTFIYTAAISQICRPQPRDGQRSLHQTRKCQYIDLGDTNPVPTESKLELLAVEDPVPLELLKDVSYLYLNGPWRNCYVRFGYDPKLNLEAVKYQVIDFRDPHFRSPAAAREHPSVAAATETKPDVHFSVHLLTGLKFISFAT